MQSNFLLSFLFIVGALYGCALTESFRPSPTKQVIGHPSTNIGDRMRTSTLFMTDEEPSKTEETEEVDDTEDIDEELPMFQLEYNPNLVDYNQLPVPPFTSAVVFFLSTAFTIYLYYIGITGGVAPPPEP